MRKSSHIASSIAAALAGIALAGAGAGAPPQAFRVPRLRLSKRYPEQSTRQELRGQRRAQGGPGIELNTSTFAYEART